MDDQTSYPPLFFITGRARSGTTLLSALLEGHPGVTVRPECPFVNDLYSKYHRHVVDSNRSASLLKDLKRLPTFSLLMLDEERFLNRWSEVNRPLNYAEVCKEVYLTSRHLDGKEGIELIGDKNPHYSLFIPRMSKLFPEAKFLHIIRDPRANVESMQRVDFETHCSASLAWRWKYYNQKAKRDLARLAPERSFVIRYEDLASNPKGTTETICQFLGIEFLPEMLNFFKHEDQIGKGYPKEALKQYHQSLFKPIDGSRMEVWKEHLSKRQVAIVEAVSRHFAKEWGYQPENQGRLSWSYFLAILGMLYGALYLLWGDFLNALPFRLRLSLMKGLARLFRPWWSRIS